MDTGTELLERASELAAIDSLLKALRRSEGRVVLVEGPAGIGKTSLLDEAVERAERANVRVRHAVADDLESDHPWGVVQGLFGDPIAQAHGAGATGAAAAIFTEAVSVGTDGPDLHALLKGLYGLTVALAEVEPLLLVVDDLQWSDHQSLRFLNYLRTRIGERPVGVLGAIRSGEAVGPETEALLGRLSLDGRAAVLAPRHLSTSGVDTLVRRNMPEASNGFCAAIGRAAHGNPFLCRAIVNAAKAEVIAPDDEGARRLNDIDHSGIRTSILVRLGRLGNGAPEVASAVAVLGSSATVGRVAALSGLDEAPAVAALDRLIAAGILAESPGVSFVHPIIRETIYSDLGPGRRRSAHRAAARVLDAGGADPDDVSTHLVLAGDCAEEWAISALVRAAGDASSRGAPDRAATLLRTAVASSPAASADPSLVAALGRAEAATGQASAIVHLEHALALHTEPHDEGALCRDLGQAHYAAEAFDGAVRSFERGLDALESLPVESRDHLLQAQLLSGLDMAGMLVGTRPARVEERLTHLRQSDHQVAQPADRVLSALAAGRHALGVGVPEDQCRVAEVAPLVEAALAGPPLHPRLGTVVVEPLALSLLLTEQLPRATAVLDQAIEAAEARGEARAHAGLLSLRGLVHLRSGALAQATADAAEAFRLATHEAGIASGPHPAARYVLVHTALERGDVDAARDAAAFEVLQASPASVLDGWHLDAIGQVALAERRPGDALEAFEQAGDLFRSSGGPAAYCPWRSDAARAAAAAGDPGTAARYAAEERALAESFGAPARLAAVLRLQAQLTSDELALGLLDDAISLLTESPLRIVRAHVWIDLGATERRLGHRKRAREHLRLGLTEATRCEASVLAARAAAELTLAGARRPDRAVHGAAALTPAERRVAASAMSGRTNRQIADDLYVSRKTVEAQLSAIYRKLGISSRAELPAALPDDASGCS